MHLRDDGAGEHAQVLVPDGFQVGGVVMEDGEGVIRDCKLVGSAVFFKSCNTPAGGSALCVTAARWAPELIPSAAALLTRYSFL